MNHIAKAAATLLIGASIGLTAASAASAAETERMALATQVFETAGSGDQIDGMIDQLAQQMADVLKQQNPQVTAEAQEEFRMRSMEQMKARKEQMMSDIAALYAAKFTEEELQGVLDFYNSDLGKKMLRESPAIQAQARTIGQQWSQNTSTEVYQQLRDQMTSEGKIPAAPAAE